jgi:hypothetical protein
MDPTQIPLRGLHFPAAISWWPLAPGWWLLIAIVVVALVLLLRSWMRRRTRAAARRHALKQLEHATLAYAEHRNPAKLGIEVSELLRRTMLAYAPRADVAGLTGDAWLEWLDRDLPASRFRQGAGRELIDLPYRDPETAGADVDLDGMLAAVRERLRTPVGGQA